MQTQTSDVKVVESKDGAISLEITEKPVVKGEVTEDSLLEQGLDPREVELAKKNNMIVDKKEDAKKEKEVTKDETTKEMSGEKKEEIKNEVEKELSEEEEHEFVGKLDKKSRGFYFDQKKERKKRQAAELERDFIKTKVKSLEEQNDLLRKSSQKTEDTKSTDELEEADPFAELRDDDVITVADIRKARAREAEIAAKKAEIARTEKEAKDKQLLEFDNKLINLEVGARERYADFDDTMTLAQEIIRNPKKVFGDDKKTMMKAIALAKVAIAEIGNVDNADPDYNAADLSYELGQLHPKYKSEKEEVNSKDEKKLSADKVEKMVANAGKRTSSASLAGGKRTVSAEDMTLDEVANLSFDEYSKLPKALREKYLRESCKT